MKKSMTLPILAAVLTVLSAAARPPNLVLILADDLGYAGLSCYGNERGLKTPALDRMAAGGIRFTDFHSNGAVCSPTRAALMTGRYQQRTGIVGVVKAKSCRNQGLSLSEVTLAEYLKRAGYATALFGKWHLGYSPKFNPVRQGFDEFVGFVSGNVDYRSHLDLAWMPDWWRGERLVPEEGYQITLETEHAVDFIRRNAERPFFLYLAYAAPHSPLQGPNDPPVRGPGAVPSKRIDAARAYREMVAEMDAGIDRVRQALDSLGLATNTLIFFASDNGPAKSYSASPALRGKKGSLFEGGHRVPAIAFWPGRIAPAMETNVAMTADLLPTFLALAGVSPDSERPLDGIDLSPLLLDRTPPPERALFWHESGMGALRRGRWKYVWTPGGDQLYDLVADLAESRNLAELHPERLARMKGAYQRLLDEVCARPTGPEIDPEASPTPPAKSTPRK